VEDGETRVGEALTPESFKAVLGRFATGVAVMATTVDGAPHGMTANSVASVSLDPPLVLVCVERSARMAEKVASAGAFALSFLPAGRDELSLWFADAGRSGAEQFEGVETSAAATGSPVLATSVGWVDCRLWASYDGGDHVIVVGEVVDLGIGRHDEPLVYYRSTYGRFAS
jgi:flavin reductase